MKGSIETLVCDTILQNPQKITVKGKEYSVAPPTAATLIEVSKYISQMPDINVNEDGNILTEVLATADKCECFGDIAAILILGKKNLKTEKKYLFGAFHKDVDNQKRLAEELLNKLTAEELNNLILELFKTMQVDFFFVTSIFLKKVNLLRKEKITASGQPSQ